MQLPQPRFIWLANNSHVLGIEHNSSPVVTVHLRPQIDITHNYKKDNRVEIIFKDDGTTYQVPDHNDLEEIIRIHLMNKDVHQLLRKHCEQYLPRV